MPSADFCTAVRPPCDGPSPVAGTRRRPPEVRPTAFAARLPDLPPRPLMTLDFAITCSLVRPGRPRYPVLVHQAAVLLHAFFRRFLAVTPLRFANPSPSSSWIEDFHLQAVVHTRHTKKAPARMKPSRSDIAKVYARGIPLCGSLSLDGSRRAGRGATPGHSRPSPTAPCSSAPMHWQWRRRSQARLTRPMTPACQRPPRR